VCEIKVDALLLHAEVFVERIFCGKVLEASAAATSEVADRGRSLRRKVLALLLVLGPRVAKVVLTSGLEK
jgi:hypothetical protein